MAERLPRARGGRSLNDQASGATPATGSFSGLNHTRGNAFPRGVVPGAERLDAILRAMLAPNDRTRVTTNPGSYEARTVEDGMVTKGSGTNSRNCRRRRTNVIGSGQSGDFGRNFGHTKHFGLD